MLCFLKRVLPFTLTLIVGLGIGSLFNLFNSKPRTAPGVLRLEGTYATGGGGCRTRMRNYSATIRSAEIYYQPKPAYTAMASKNYVEGDVTLRVTLGADGSVSSVEPITRLPYGLTEEAVRAARQIRFTPATRDGSPVDEVKTITYSFDLQ